MTLLFTGLAALGTLAFLGLLCWFLEKHPPQWEDDDENPLEVDVPWRRIFTLSLLATLPAVVIASLNCLLLGGGVLALALIPSTGFMAFMATQATITDVKVRRVDGRFQYAFILVLGVMNYLALTQADGPQPLLGKMMVIFALGMLAFRFLVPVRQVGDADFRALAMMSVATLPFLTLTGFTWGLELFGVAAIAYALLQLRKRPRTSASKTLIWLGKVSLPLVPLLMWPQVLLLLFLPFLPL